MRNDEDERFEEREEEQYEAAEETSAELASTEPVGPTAASAPETPAIRKRHR